MDARRLITWVGRVVGLAPGIRLMLQELHGSLNPPGMAAIHRLGYWALIFLLASLTCSPLTSLFGWTWLHPLRRTLGLWAWTYATGHVLLYIAWDQRWDMGAIWEAFTQHAFMPLGMVSFVLLAVLALTSYPQMIHALGPTRWKQLHRLAYVAAAAGVAHFMLYIPIKKKISWLSIGQDLAPFTLEALGMLGILLLLPGMILSMERALVRRGWERWSVLQRWAWVGLGGGIVCHMGSLQADLRKPLICASLLCVLLSMRLSYAAGTAGASKSPPPLSKG